MAYTDTLTIQAHHNIYNGFNERMLRIDYSIPKNGTNEETGLFILVPGFGAHIDSKVYAKMRSQFADQYNVVTIQCDYFGSKFMQSVEQVNIPDNIEYLKKYISREIYEEICGNRENILSIIGKYAVSIPVLASINENENEFVDMGYMQAIDNITAIEAIKIILRENNLMFNEERIMGFGQSQGAYLLHLMNRMAPHMFSLIIDNSAWVQPVYLTANRALNMQYGHAMLSIEFDYIAKRLIKNIDALSLHELYKDSKNGAYIYSCLGTNDNLVNLEDKKRLIEKIDFVKFEIIDEHKIDNSIFNSTGHGVGADFILLTKYVLDSLHFEHINPIEKREKYIIESALTKVSADYSHGLPLFNFIQ